MIYKDIKFKLDEIGFEHAYIYWGEFKLNPYSNLTA
jgi:hypothetical protein